MERTRAARPADLDRLLELATIARAELLSERGGAMWSRREAHPHPRRNEFLDAMDDDRAHLLLGCVDDYPVGYGLARIEVLRTGEALGVVSDIFVEAPFRGVAVGEAVMDALIAWAEAAGCIGIDSLVLPGMRDSKNFFERYRMTARAILVHRSFLPAPSEDAPPTDLPASEVPLVDAPGGCA